MGRKYPFTRRLPQHQKRHRTSFLLVAREHVAHVGFGKMSVLLARSCCPPILLSRCSASQSFPRCSSSLNTSCSLPSSSSTPSILVVPHSFLFQLSATSYSVRACHLKPLISQLILVCRVHERHRPRRNKHAVLLTHWHLPTRGHMFDVRLRRTDSNSVSLIDDRTYRRQTGAKRPRPRNSCCVACLLGQTPTSRLPPHGGHFRLRPPVSQSSSTSTSQRRFFEEATRSWLLQNRLLSTTSCISSTSFLAPSSPGVAPSPMHVRTNFIVSFSAKFTGSINSYCVKFDPSVNAFCIKFTPSVNSFCVKCLDAPSRSTTSLLCISQLVHHLFHCISQLACHRCFRLVSSSRIPYHTKASQ